MIRSKFGKLISIMDVNQIVQRSRRLNMFTVTLKYVRNCNHLYKTKLNYSTCFRIVQVLFKIYLTLDWNYCVSGMVFHYKVMTVKCFSLIIVINLKYRMDS